MAKPCLGYPTRTAAVVALRKQGLLTREIAARVGISTGTVTALEASHGRGTRPNSGSPAVGAIRMARLDDYFAAEILIKLRPHAAKRDMSVARLIKTLVETCALDGMVDAVLDDGATS